MGQDLSKSLVPPSFTLLDCLVNGKLDVARCIYFRRKQDYIDLDNQCVAISIGKKRKAPCSQDSIKPRKKRSIKKHKLLVRNDDGTLRELTSKDTL